MRRSLTPIWIGAASRFAGSTPRTAGLVLGMLALLALGATLTALSAPGGEADASAYAAVVEGMRHGGNYYTVTADVLRSSGYTLRPFLAFRLPTLFAVLAALPDLAALILFHALAAGVAVAWYRRLTPVLATRTAGIVLVIATILAMPALIHPPLIDLPESWAGLFVALSLALHRPDRWIESIAFALAAALIREVALLYMLIMAVFAWGEHRTRETTVWALALAIVIAALAFHAHAVAGIVRPLDPPANLLAPLGIGMAVRAFAGAMLPAFLPLALGAPLVVLAAFGWASRRDPVAARILVFVAVMTVVVGVFGHADTPHWGSMVAPALAVGLVFIPDALRDLIAATFATRRITVRRIVR